MEQLYDLIHMNALTNRTTEQLMSVLRDFLL